MKRDDIARACRENDQIVDEGGKVPDVLGALGADEHGVLYVAEQRALRMVIHLRGGKMPVERESVLASPADLAAFAAVWLDGFAAGLRAGTARGLS